MNKNKKTKEREEAQKRIEEARKKIMLERERFKGKVPQITNQLLEGVNYSEDVIVKLKDGSYGNLKISSLSEGQLLDAFAVLGMDKLQEIESGGDLDIKDYDFFWTIVSMSTELDKELIKKTFASGEAAWVAQKILEISGAAGEDIESFPEK